MSLTSQIRVVIKGRLNDLLTKTIDMNSPSALRQYARDLQEAINQANTNAAVSAAGITTRQREAGILTSQIVTAKAAAVKLMASTDPNAKTLALAKAKLIIELNAQLAQKQTEITEQSADSAELDQQVAVMQGKISTLNSRIKTLENMDRDTKAKAQSTAALHQVADLLSTGSDIHVDDIEARMTAAHDIANEQFHRQIAAMGDGEPVDNTDAEELLASLAPPATLAQGAAS